MEEKVNRKLKCNSEGERGENTLRKWEESEMLVKRERREIQKSWRESEER